MSLVGLDVDMGLGMVVLGRELEARAASLRLVYRFVSRLQ
jgi:hypothetical protein